MSQAKPIPLLDFDSSFSALVLGGGQRSKRADMRFEHLYPLSHTMERLAISRMIVDLLRPLSLAICMVVQPSWVRNSMRFLSSEVICVAILAVLSFCFATSLVRTRRHRGVEMERVPYLRFARLNAPCFPREVIGKRDICQTSTILWCPIQFA